MDERPPMHRNHRRAAALWLAVGCLAPFGAGAQDAVLFKDNFDSIASGRPPGWAIIGAIAPEYWSVDGGRFYTGKGDVYRARTFAIVEAPAAADWTDYSVSATFVAVDPKGHISLAARWTDTKNYYFVNLVSFPGNRRVEIFRRVNGEESEVKTTEAGSQGTLPVWEADNAAAKPHKVEFTLRGNQLSVAVDGAVLLTAQDDTFKHGTAGIGQWYDQVYFDDVEVRGAGTAVALTGGGAGGTAPTGKGVPSTARPGEDAWRILVLEGVSAKDARERAADLGDFPDADVLAKGSAFALYLGRFATEDEAKLANDKYRRELGILTAGVERVSGAAPTPAPTAVVEAGKLLRLVANVSDSQPLADETKRSLIQLGYYLVDVIPQDGRFAVAVGPQFADSNEAESAAATMRQSGFPSAKSLQLPGTPPPLEAPSDAEVQQRADAAGVTVSKAERQRVADILRDAKRQLEGGASAADIEALKGRIASLDAATQQLVQQFAQGHADGAPVVAPETVTEIADLRARIDAAVEDGRLDEALLDARSWERLAPNDQAAKDKVREIVERQAQKAEGDKDRDEQFERQLNAARAYADEGKYIEALQAAKSVMDSAKPGATFDRAATMVAEYRPRAKEQSDAEVAAISRARIIKYVSILGGLLLIAGGGYFAMVFSRKRAAAKAAEPATKPAAPAKSPTAAVATVAVPTPTQKPGKGAAAVPSTDSDRIRPGVMSPAPGVGPSIADVASGRVGGKPATPARTEESTTDGILGPVFGGVRETTPQEPAIARASTPKPVAEDEGGLKLDFLFGDSPNGQAPAPIPATPSPREMALSAPSGPASTEFRLPPLPDTNPILSPPEIAAARAAVIDLPQAGVLSSGDQESTEKIALPGTPKVAASDLHYLQGFDEEELGKPPRNWNGNYDYASLLVVQGGNGSGRCMKFEKKVGNGSAYYSCRFPDASGKVVVEFDLRCDDKNKYLLGFYIEKDEDFRQSIHTIVHRTNSQAPPTLRIQGEPTKYELGKWVRIRYEIDLPRHIIDAFVDGNTVATGVRLTSPPKVLNTLSIRDNLATTGVLMVDNVRIARG